jgi:hypothetical protein
VKKRRKKNGQNVKRKAPAQASSKTKREPSELELLIARGIGRAVDFADKTLEVVERDPERAVVSVERFLEGVGKIGDFVKKNPERAKAIAGGLAAEGVNRIGYAVIAAGARQARRKLKEQKS